MKMKIRYMKKDNGINYSVLSKAIKRILSAMALLIFLPTLVYSQVFSNSDFEELSDCPEYLGEVYLCEGWTQVIAHGDFFNCDFATEVYPSPTAASSGTGYIGMGTYGNLIGAAESIGQQLETPLAIGQEYTIYLDVKDVTGGPFGQDCTGICLYGFMEQPPEGFAFIHTQDLEGAVLLDCGNPITDTTWVSDTLTFVPDNNYEFLVFTPGIAPECYQYMFIDNIRETIPSNVEEGEEEIIVLPNPLKRGDDLDKYLNSENEIVRWQWFSPTGMLIESRSEARVPESLSTGIYILKINYSKDRAPIIRRVIVE